MGLLFGGLQVLGAADSAAQYGRVSQLAVLGEQVTGLVQALQNERDETAGMLPAGGVQPSSSPQLAASLQSWYDATDAVAARVQVQAAHIGGSFPANVQSTVANARLVIRNLVDLRSEAQISPSAAEVIADYAPVIGDLISLNTQIAEGTTDGSLASAVQELDALSLAKDAATQQRALLYNALTQQIFAPGELQALTTADSEQATDMTAFDATTSAAQQNAFRSEVAGPLVSRANIIEQSVIGDSGGLDISSLDLGRGSAPAQWYAAMSSTVGKMQAFELGVASSIVARSQQLEHGAERSAVLTGLATGGIMLLVLVTMLLVARSLVRPLRRLREGALTIATVELPERVRQLGEGDDPDASPEVTPIDVVSADEIGQVARAFDQVHAEAVRLASKEAMLRGTFNAMFLSLSRRSQVLIERLARMIDALEQHEGDPGRLSDLFAMDHLVTRMRRNSENLLLLAGHENTRRWNQSVSLADVVRAATSEIEQYRRVVQRVQPGVAIAGQAVSDVAHLLAELIENATIFSPRESSVHVAAAEQASGGVLVEVADSGVGIPQARLAAMNVRLDSPPVIDVSVSRHMGLFAVSYLAQRHGVRIRLVAGKPRGLTALIWLPDSVIEREASASAWTEGRLGRTPAAAASQFADDWSTGGQFSSATLAAASAPTGPVSTGLVSTGPVPTGPVPTGPVPTGPGPTGPGPTGAVLAGAVPPGVAPARAVPPGAVSAGPVPAAPLTLAAPTSAGASSGWFSGRSSSGTAAPAAGSRAAQPLADPVISSRTAAGLPVRVPQANRIPSSLGGQSTVGGQESQPQPRPERSPELARNRLSGFQRGNRRATGQRPGAGEEADR
jgi:signal transduction histidine kinase